MIRKTIAVLSILLLFICEARAQALITPGVPVTSNTSLTVANGTAFAIPQGRGVIITWQTSFSVAPTSITVQLQFSLDNTSYFMVDSSTSTTGELRYLGPISARFVRCAVTAVTVGAGAGFQCKINVLGFNNPAVFSGGTLSSSITMAGGTQIKCNGTALLPCYAASTTPSSGLWFYNEIYPAISSSGITTAAFFNLDLQFKSDASFGFATGIVGATSSDTRFRRTATKTVTFDDGAGGAATLSIIGSANAEGNFVAGIGGSGVIGFFSRSLYSAPVNGVHRLSNNAITKSLDFQSVDLPTCTTNCGTTPTVVGVSSSFTLTMGTTPASGFQINFPTAWVAAPQCLGSMALAGMVIGKLPLTYATTTTTLTIVTNGTAPSTGDKYHFICSLGQ